MSGKNFTEKDKETIHYIFGSLYLNSYNKFAAFNGHVYSKWITKEDNKAFFSVHYPDYQTSLSQTDLPKFLLRLLHDIDQSNYNWPILNFISLINLINQQQRFLFII